MHPFIAPRFAVLSLMLLAPGLASAAVSTLVLQSDQNPLDGSLRNGGSGIAAGEIKTLPFTSGTSFLELTSVELGLIASTAGSHQISFQLYSATSTGEPQTLLYSTTFTPTLTTLSAWYSLPISYTLNPSTTYAFGFAASSSLLPDTAVKWSNTTNSVNPPLAYQGFGTIGTNGFVFSSIQNLWIQAAADNSFRLYAVPETPAGALSGLGLVAIGAYRFRRRLNSPRREDS